MSDKKTVLSAIQPTGDIHLGNYLGAVQNWVHLQEEYDCVYGVVDYHSVTMPYDPVKLRMRTWNIAFQLLACGIEPGHLFIQSLVPEHAELCWLLGCVTSYGDLTRMTQFKDKSDQVRSTNKDALISGGLFYYPVLQAADILIYKADYVPVGKDQEQHLELTRGIAQRFNTQFGKEYFQVPQSLFTKTPKILSLADPTKKMSKSLGDKHVVNMFGDLNVVRKQVRSAVTDSGASEEMSPGVHNLIQLLDAAGKDDAVAHFNQTYADGTLRYSDLKQEVSDALVEMLTPIQERYKEIMADKKSFKDQIKQSSHQVRLRAAETVREVKDIMGLLNVKPLR